MICDSYPDALGDASIHKAYFHYIARLVRLPLLYAETEEIAQRICAHHQQLGGIFVTDRIFAAWMEHLDWDPEVFHALVRRKRHTHTMRSGFHGPHVPARRRHCHMLNGESSRHFSPRSGLSLR